jgi:hypothetical protein
VKLTSEEKVSLIRDGGVFQHCGHIYRFRWRKRQRGHDMLLLTERLSQTGNWMRSELTLTRFINGQVTRKEEYAQ